MHPEVKSKAAGSCPKCGMTLKHHSNSQVSEAQKGTPWGANYFPNVMLTTQDGSTVRFYDDLVKDKVVAINLIYTTCKYNCPLETARLAQVQKMLGDRVGRDIFFYSITIDPIQDTPAALKAYAEKYHAGPGWLFLTGKQQDIDLISKKLGLDSLPNPSDPDRHIPALLIGNAATGLWMRNSAMDNPRFLAIKLEQMLGWQNAKEGVRAASKLDLDKGQYLFATQCGACHTIGHGDRVGPDLLGVTKTRDRAWLAKFIATPDKMLEEKDPIAAALFRKYKEIRMPNLGLHEVDVTTLIQYLQSQTATLEREKAAATPKPETR
ncbi:MAG TPA: SCO family protein [Blastocatellia bacterium]|nr:SCO family protein [Blastocatellia bacterium]